MLLSQLLDNTWRKYALPNPLESNHAKYQTSPTLTSNPLPYFRILPGCHLFIEDFRIPLAR